MFCTKCGMKNDDDALFCAGCGSPIKKPQTMQQPQLQKIEQQSENIKEESKTNDDIGFSFFQQVEETKNEQELESQSENAEEPIVESQSETINESIVETLSEPQPENVTESSFGEIRLEQGADTVFETQNEPMPETKVEEQPVQSQFNEQPIQSQFNAQSEQSQFNAHPTQSQFNAQPIPSQYNNMVASPQKENKFSFKRFIFSALLIIVTLASCATIFMTYVTAKYDAKAYGERQKQEEKIKGLDIIKDGVTEDYKYEIEGYEIEDIVDTAKLFRTMVSVLEISLIIFSIIELVLLIGVRRRWAYVLTMLFSLIKLGLGGFVSYIWCFEFLDDLKEYFETTYSSLFISDMSMKITAGLGIGLILALAAQGLVFIFSIILMTCKNRKKVKAY